MLRPRPYELLDLDGGEWSPEACQIFGVDAASLPRIAPNAGPVGETTAFGPPLPVTGLCVDQQAALFAERCFEAGQTKCTYGTGAFVLAAAGKRPRRSTGGLAACVAWRLGGETEYCLDGQVYTAGAAVTWLEQLGVIRDAAQLDDLCGQRAPAADEPLFVPALAGLGAPWWRPDARATLSGLSLASGRSEVARSVVWGMVAADRPARQVDRVRPRRPLWRPSCRRWTDAFAQPASGAGRPAPDARRGLPVSRGDRARRGSVRAHRCRPRCAPADAWRRGSPETSSSR